MQKTITENKLLLSKINDIFSLCEKYSCPRFSQFLDGGEIAVIQDSMRFPYGFNTMLFGGFLGSEKKILGVFPEWSEPCEDEFPVSVLRISSRYTDKLTHRDYLGALLSLGIERSKLGDIVVDSEQSAYCFVCEDIAGYICDNLNKIGRAGVSVEVIPLNSVHNVGHKFERLELVCASLRADAVVGAVTRLSRQKAAELIGSAKVKINHRVIDDNSKILSEGDLVSVRGFGRYIIRESGGKTRKDRLHITVDKYV